MATGEYPYKKKERQTVFHLFQKIINNAPPKLDPEKFDPDLCDFVNQCLKKQPEERASAAELLKHPFLKNLDEQELQNQMKSRMKH